MSDNLRDQFALLPGYLSSHILLVLLALAAGLALSVPAGILATRVRALRGPVLAVVSVIQPVPALALLALMVTLIGRIGFTPAIIALILYSMLPILRNTVTGLDGVSPEVVEAARGIGMKPNQVLLKVRLPLAMPVIIAGLRTATVWTVGMATLATPVGATSLGNYIFTGLQTQNRAALLMGSIAAALLALVLDGLIHLLESGARKGRPVLWGAGAAGLLLAAVIGLWPVGAEALGDLSRDEVDRGVVRVGSKPFAEQRILAELIALRLERNGFIVERKESLGSTVAFEALSGDQLDCYVDYSGTLWANLMNRQDNPGADVVLESLEPYLRDQHDVHMLCALGFENRYALAMREEQARQLGIASVEDLAPHAPDMVLGADYEFLGRPEWESLRDAYGLAFRDARTMDPDLMYRAIREEQLDVIPAYSTEGRVAAYNLRILKEPEGALPPYDAVLLLSDEAVVRGALVDALRPLCGAFTDQLMRQANMMVSQEGDSVAAAAQWLDEHLPQ